MASAQDAEDALVDAGVDLRGGARERGRERPRRQLVEQRPVPAVGQHGVVAGVLVGVGLLLLRAGRGDEHLARGAARSRGHEQPARQPRPRYCSSC